MSHSFCLSACVTTFVKMPLSNCLFLAVSCLESPSHRLYLTFSDPDFCHSLCETFLVSLSLWHTVSVLQSLIYCHVLQSRSHCLCLAVFISQSLPHSLYPFFIVSVSLLYNATLYFSQFLCHNFCSSLCFQICFPLFSSHCIFSEPLVCISFNLCTNIYISQYLSHSLNISISPCHRLCCTVYFSLSLLQWLFLTLSASLSH
jgi:hypothetical protein